MLAPPDDPLKNKDYFKSLNYPLLCSPKLDGVRMVVKALPELSFTDDLEAVENANFGYKCLSRTLKEIPSRQVQQEFSMFSELDGELIAGDETSYNVCNRTVSYVMSVDKRSSELKYRVFDCADEELAELPFEERLECARGIIAATKATSPDSNVTLIEHTLCRNYEELIDYETQMLSRGYEGIMLRNALGRYKHNRGTFREGLIYKLKRFSQDEATIRGFEEGFSNLNVKTEDERGYAKRSTAKDGLVPADTLGNFICDFDGLEIKVAPGVLSHDEREAIWRNPDPYIGKRVTFRHFAYGVKCAPRFARFVAFRDDIDMS